MSLSFLVNKKPMEEMILAYLQGREFVSIGELNSHCADQISDKPVTDIHENYLFYLSVCSTVKKLKENGLVETKEIENDLWVKLNEEVQK